jgi:hypothetical protein
VKGVPAKLESVYRAEGLGGAFLAACRRAVRYRRIEEIILEHNLTEKRLLSMAPTLTMRPVEPRDRDLLAAFHAEHGIEPNQRYRVNRYFDHGYRGFLAFAADALIGYLFWVDNTSAAADRHPHLRIYDIPLRDREVYGFDFYIAQRHRGGSRALEFFDRFEGSLVEAGYRKAYGLVIATKKPARFVYASFGYKPIRTEVGHKFFGAVAVLNGRVFRTTPNMY